MKYECKYCGENQTGNVLQDMINRHIKDGRIYIDSSGNEEKDKESRWCKCKEEKNEKSKI